VSNIIGVTEFDAPNIPNCNAGESINFYGGYNSGNTQGAFVNANYENNLFGLALDFNGPSNGAQISNSQIECHSCHFEQHHGAVYQGSSFTSYGGVFLLGNVSSGDPGIDPYMINMTGPVATLHVDGGSFTSNHPVTQLVKWQADLTHGGELTLHNVKGNGNYNIGPGTSGLPVMVGTPFPIFPGVHIISQFNDDGFVVNGS